MARAPKKQPPPPMADLAGRIASRWSGAGGEVALDRLVSELGEVPRYDIVAALKELEKAGAGTFEVGRAGRKARFLWSGKKVAVEKAKSEKVESVPAKSAAKPPKRSDEVPLQVAQRVKLAAKSAPTLAAGDLEHRFHLRPGFIVSVRLPADVTGSEVARFCQFLQAIPFSEG